MVMISTHIMFDRKRFKRLTFHHRRGKAFPHYFYTFLYQYISSVSDAYEPSNDPITKTNTFNLPSPLANNEIADADAKIERIYRDFDKIAFFLTNQGDNSTEDHPRARRGERRRTLSGMPRSTGTPSFFTTTLIPDCY
jgi:hypothetical protein